MKKTAYILLTILFYFNLLSFWPNEKPAKDNSDENKTQNESVANIEEKEEIEDLVVTADGEFVIDTLALDTDEEKKDEAGAAVGGDEDYFKVLRVIDGDTIDVDINGQSERVRLIGINTPESVDPRKPVECFGKEASAKAQELLLGKKVILEADETQSDRDKYGRLLRYVTTQEGVFFNLEIIRLGYAYEYTYDLPYRYREEFKEAQRVAESTKAGLWADGACGAVNLENKNCQIKGNVSAKGEKIYHLPECPHYNQTTINEEMGERWFCTEEEANNAGWRKAKNCL